MHQDWGKWVIIKQNAAEILEKELMSWYKKNPDRPPKIYMSSVTDPYQPIESKEQLTRQLLDVMAAYRPILVIQTRSPISSTGRRTPSGSEFARFAKENLPQQMQMSNLKRQYIAQNDTTSYALDDYIILAKK